MEPVRIVLDTNVLVSALCFGGVPAGVLRLALAGKIELATSEALIDEFKAVMRLKFPRREPAVLDALNEFALLWEVVPSAALPDIRAIADDPSDDRVLECAVAARAKFIVSGDKHLLRLGRFGGILILSPSAFLRSVPPQAPG